MNCFKDKMPRVLGFTVIAENYRAERDSYKTDLALNGNYTLELFSFPNPPARVSRPEAAGLRHLAFKVDNIDNAILELDAMNVEHEAVRLPIEFYEK